MEGGSGCQMRLSSAYFVVVSASCKRLYLQPLYTIRLLSALAPLSHNDEWTEWFLNIMQIHIEKVDEKSSYCCCKLYCS